MNWYQKYILPGLIFQSVVIGGGYATGRELIAFFADSGPVGGLLGLLVSACVFGLVLAIGFEVARINNAYDYRLFCKALLGRYWVFYELAFLCLLLLILSVIGSAAGKMVGQSFGIPTVIGTIFLMGFVAALSYSGSDWIKKVFAFWSILLYVVYLTLFVLAFSEFGENIDAVFRESDATEGWFKSGILYSGYNLAILPMVLFAVGQHGHRQESIGAGLLAGLLAIVPAMLFYVAMMSAYPSIKNEAVPAAFLTQQINLPWLTLLFHVVVFGTLIETATGLLHAVNERIDCQVKERGLSLPRTSRPLITLFFLIVSIFAADQIGIIALIGQGYSALTVVFLLILVLPLTTVGLWQILRGHGAGRGTK
jgi:uncharacterized membrane protein YkvI